MHILVLHITVLLIINAFKNSLSHLPQEQDDNNEFITLKKLYALNLFEKKLRSALDFSKYAGRRFYYSHLSPKEKWLMLPAWLRKRMSYKSTFPMYYPHKIKELFISVNQIFTEVGKIEFNTSLLVESLGIHWAKLIVHDEGLGGQKCKLTLQVAPITAEKFYTHHHTLSQHEESIMSANITSAIISASKPNRRNLLKFKITSSKPTCLKSINDNLKIYLIVGLKTPKNEFLNRQKRMLNPSFHCSKSQFACCYQTFSIDLVGSFPWAKIVYPESVELGLCAEVCEFTNPEAEEEYLKSNPRISAVMAGMLNNRMTVKQLNSLGGCCAPIRYRSQSITYLKSYQNDVFENIQVDSLIADACGCL